MKKMKFGNTGMMVSQIGYGASEIGWADTVSEKDAELVLHAALDAGVNFFDAAPDYGICEERIGNFISSRRKEFYLATKCGCDPVSRGGKGGHIWTRDQIMKNIEESLVRLKTEYIDVYQIHSHLSPDEPIEEMAGILHELKAQGLIRFVAISTSAQMVGKLAPLGIFDAFQTRFNFLTNDPAAPIMVASESGAGIIIRGATAKGGPDRWKEAEPRAYDKYYRKSHERYNEMNMSELLGDMKPAELILRYTLSHTFCHTAIVGTKRVAHLNENIASAEKGPLSAELMAEIERRIEPVVAH